MRYLNIEDKSPSAEWCEKAEQKTEQLKRLSSSEERKDFIGKTLMDSITFQRLYHNRRCIVI